MLLVTHILKTNLGNMNFKDIQFMKNGFSLTREDSIEIFFPYSKFEFITLDPEKFRLRIEIKKHGAFTREYPSCAEARADGDRLIGAGKK